MAYLGMVENKDHVRVVDMRVRRHAYESFVGFGGNRAPQRSGSRSATAVIERTNAAAERLNKDLVTCERTRRVPAHQ